MYIQKVGNFIYKTNYLFKETIITMRIPVVHIKETIILYKETNMQSKKLL